MVHFSMGRQIGKNCADDNNLAEKRWAQQLTNSFLFQYLPTIKLSKGQGNFVFAPHRGDTVLR